MSEREAFSAKDAVSVRGAFRLKDAASVEEERCPAA
jgi:hypothetical protein